jgi:hypothetical protein
MLNPTSAALLQILAVKKPNNGLSRFFIPDESERDSGLIPNTIGACRRAAALVPASAHSGPERV